MSVEELVADFLEQREDDQGIDAAVLDGREHRDGHGPQNGDRQHKGRRGGIHGFFGWGDLDMASHSNHTIGYALGLVPRAS